MTGATAPTVHMFRERALRAWRGALEAQRERAPRPRPHLSCVCARGTPFGARMSEERATEGETGAHASMNQAREQMTPLSHLSRQRGGVKR